MSVAEETRGEFEVSVCTMDDRYYEIPEEGLMCEIQFREDVFIFISLLALMLKIFLRTENAWLKANYNEHIPLFVSSTATPLIIHNIELFLIKFITIYNNFLIFTGSKIFQTNLISYLY
jgi:hypothetical protein